MGMNGCEALMLALLTATVATAPPPRRVTISGQSAGGSQAIDHLVAFSGSVDGAAIVAGSPYGCGNLTDENSACYYGLAPLDIQKTVEYLRNKYREGLIDNPKNMRKIPTMLFSSKNDWVVYTSVMKAVHEQLQHFIAPGNLHVSFNTSAVSAVVALRC